jgi:hypothetical protein
MAMVVVLSMVVVLGAIVAFAITMSGSESRNTGKLVHNMSMQSLTEATLQYGRNYFATNYGANGSRWNLFLAYFVDTPLLLDTQANLTATLNHLQNDTLSDGTPVKVLINTNTPSGTTCYVHVRDNVDELPPLTNNPRQDNDLLIYLGAVCVQQGGGNTQSQPLVAELVAPLLFNASSAMYLNQASGGTQGVNNASVTTSYR